MSSANDPLSHHLYRVEVFLTTTDKNGTEILPKTFRSVISEIYGRFHGLTMTAIEGNPVYEGFWRSRKKRKDMHEKTSIVTVFVPQTPESMEFFRDRKPQWIQLLNYEELLVTVDEVRTL